MRDVLELNIDSISKTIRKNLSQILFLTLFFVLGVLTVNLFAARTYKAETTIYPLENDRFGYGLRNLYVGEEYRDSRIAILLQGNSISEKVICDLKLKCTIQELVDKTNIYFANNLIHFSVVWNNPKEATEIANAYLKYLGEDLNKLSLPVSYLIVERGREPRSVFQPKLARNIFLGFLLGIAVSVFWTVLIEFGYRALHSQFKHVEGVT